MKIITVKERQSISDIALQYCGDAEVIFRIAEINDISITETLHAGQELAVPDPVNKRVADYYKNNGINPATAGDDDSQLITSTGEYLMTNNNEKIIENE